MSTAKKKRNETSSVAGCDGVEVTARKRGRKVFVSKRGSSGNSRAADKDNVARIEKEERVGINGGQSEDKGNNTSTSSQQERGAAS